MKMTVLCRILFVLHIFVFREQRWGKCLFYLVPAGGLKLHLLSVSVLTDALRLEGRRSLLPVVSVSRPGGCCCLVSTVVWIKILRAPDTWGVCAAAADDWIWNSPERCPASSLAPIAPKLGKGAINEDEGVGRRAGGKLGA